MHSIVYSVSNSEQLDVACASKLDSFVSNSALLSVLVVLMPESIPVMLTLQVTR